MRRLQRIDCCPKCGSPIVDKHQGFEEMSREECITILCRALSRALDEWGYDADAQVVTMASRFLIADEKRISALVKRVELLEKRQAPSGAGGAT